jgi:outer membrane immunogenic protein
MHRVNKYVFGLVAGLIAATGSARANWLATGPFDPSAINWNGVYVGGHGGMGTADVDSRFDGSAIGAFTPGDISDTVIGRFFELDGFLGGVHVGVNQSNGRFVYGLEGDWSHFGESDRLLDQNANGPDDTDNASIEIDWLASLRARAGVTSAQTLFYGTLGAAWVGANYTAQNASNNQADQGTANLNDVGQVVGGGIEHAVTNQLLIRLEALYYHFDNRVDTSALNTDSDLNDFATIKDVLVARLGVSYKLGEALHAAQPGQRSAAEIIWNGLYAGGHAGYGRVDFNSIFDSDEIDRIVDIEDSVEGRFFDLDGAVGGVHVGVNHAVGRFVFGLEGDLTAVDRSDRLFDQETEFGGTDSASADVNWLASVRGRAGVVSAQTLFYATAGAAWVDADYAAQEADDGQLDGGSTDVNDAGVVVGGGMEHALNSNLLIRFEALHYEFDGRTDTSSLTTDSDPDDFAAVASVTVVRVGGSYKFGMGAN